MFPRRERGAPGAFSPHRHPRLKLHPHFHAVFLDGVFVAGPDGKPVFHTLPRISDTAVADLLQVIRSRVIRFLVRRAVVLAESEISLLPDELAEREPALAQLAAAAVQGLPPAGPELRRKPITIALGASFGPKVVVPAPPTMPAGSTCSVTYFVPRSRRST